MTGALDWDDGHYERIAEQLAPAAAAVVEEAAPAVGEEVLDVGCGTGSAALVAARRGAHVLGVDPSPRLLDVARAQAQAEGLPADFLAGTAEALPTEGACADVVVSSFGVIFAGDPRRAAAEIGRVARPRARVVFSAWLPAGALAAVMRARAQAVAPAAPPPPPAFAWHSADSVEELFAPHGFAARIQPRELAFTDSSPEAFIDGELRDHPAWLSTAAALERAGGVAALRDEALEILSSANEDPEAFRITSGYVIVTLTRAGGG
jgi:SAM-dependent methyltransferase